MTFKYETVECYLTIVDLKTIEVWVGCEHAKEEERFPWTPYDLTRAMKIWADFMKTGVVRDQKGLDRMADDFVNKIATIKAMTILAGHTQLSPKDIIEGLELTWSDETDDKIGEYILDEQGQYRISDYAMNELEELAGQIIEAPDSVTKLLYLDRVLNVVHQRSDIASWFIKGGRCSLDELQDQEI